MMNMSSSAQSNEEKQGILSFFQSSPSGQRKAGNTSLQSKEDPVIDLDATTVSNTAVNNVSINSDNSDQSRHNISDGTIEEGQAHDLIEKSDAEPEQRKSRTKNVKENSTKSGAVDTQHTPSTKHDELKRQRELKRKQKEDEKRRREELRQAERLKREQQREEEKKRREDRKRQKELERLEAKKQKENEKRLKEEEKRLKDEEKRLKEEEKHKKEEEKKMKEMSKERAQSRIGNFFKKIQDGAKQINVQSDYQKFFLPFYTKDGTILHRNGPLTSLDLKTSKTSLDSILCSGRGSADNDEVLDWLNSKKVEHGYKVKFTATALLQQMTAKQKEDVELMDLLLLIPQKYIKFYENVRPPYIGTYSKDSVLPVDNPFSMKDTGYNYDYDSDLDWINEEEEEGEEGGVDNLESGEEDEDDDEDEASEGEFDGFLEAEDRLNDSSQNKKRKFLGPLVPTVSLRTNSNDMSEADRKYFEEVSVSFLSQQQPFPIDPTVIVKPQTVNGAKRHLIEEQGDEKSASSSPSVSPEKKKPKQLITDPASLLKLFEEIDGSTFSIMTVTEIAQKNLPQYSKQLIKNTVKEYAIRGTGPARKWQIKDQQYWKELQKSGI